jgi:hypothetical protein
LVNDQPGCCSRSDCCAPSAEPEDGQFHKELGITLERFNVNDYAASVRVYTLKT